RDGVGFDHKSHYRRAARPDLLSPTPQDYDSQGHLYHGALNGLIELVEQSGEDKVFVGHDQSQVAAAEFGLPGLFKVTDLASAKRAIEVIVAQRDDSHYARFAAVNDEYRRLSAARPDFAPARPAAENPTFGDVRERPGMT